MDIAFKRRIFPLVIVFGLTGSLLLGGSSAFATSRVVVTPMEKVSEVKKAALQGADAFLRQTPIMIKNVDDISAISQDGAYLYVVNHGAQFVNSAGWIEDMNGKLWKVPNVYGGATYAPQLGAETGRGVFVFTEIAGSSPIAYAFRPGVGIVPHFMDHRADPYAESMYSATESSQGHWMSVRTNSPAGAGPGVYQWVDIDHTPIPMLTDARALTWSPNGVEAGYFSAQLGQNEGWLGIYHVTTHRVQLLDLRNPFVLAQPAFSQGSLQGWQSTGFYSGSPSTAIVQWSPSGDMIAAERQKPVSLQVISLNAGTSGTIPIPSPPGSQNYWGWTPKGEVYVAERSAIALYRDDEGRWTLAHSFHVDSSINRVVDSTQGIWIGTDSGKIYRIASDAVSLVTSTTVGAWWFDTKNNRLYVLPNNAKGHVYSVNF